MKLLSFLDEAIGGVIFFFLAIAFIVGIVLLVLCIIFAVQYKRDNRYQVKGGMRIKKYKKWFAIILGIAGTIIILVVTWMGANTFSLFRIENDGKNKYELAIASDDLKGVKEMLKEKPELINYVSVEGDNSLIQAIHSGSVNVTAYFLKEGVPIDETGGYKRAIEIWADDLDDLDGAMDVLDVLLDHQADINSHELSWPPMMLMMSYICDDKEIDSEEILYVQQFLDAGADVSIKNDYGQNTMDFYEEEVKENEMSGEKVEQMREMLNV